MDDLAVTSHLTLTCSTAVSADDLAVTNHHDCRSGRPRFGEVIKQGIDLGPRPQLRGLRVWRTGTTHTQND